MFISRSLSRLVACAAVFSCLCGACGLSVLGQGANEAQTEPDKALAVREDLNRGVEAYKAGRYDEAIAHFRKAMELDPSSRLAKAYLATSLAQEVVPGLDTPDNLKMAQQSIDLFKQILAKDPHDGNSLKQVAGICYSLQRFDDAREWQKRVLVEDPTDPEAAYTIGVIDWTQAHQNALKALLSVGLADDGMGNTKAPPEVMATIKAQNGRLVEEALNYLNQAILNRSNYDDAMAYINLAYRRKADLDWDNEAAREEDLARAEEWVKKAMDARRAKEQKVISVQPRQ